MDTLLLIEDDKLLRRTLKENLEQEDFVILEAAAGKRSIEILKQHTVDLILLDLHLPDGSGLDFIEDIRRCTNAPVIIVSGDNKQADRLDGFNRGADDYVNKPFAVNELIARIKANIRRYKETPPSSGQNMKDANTAGTEKLALGKWTVNPAQYQIFDENGRSGELTMQEFLLLQLLISHPGQVLKREELGEVIREGNYIPAPRAIDVKITRIRKKIGDNALNPEMIKTVRGAGYMFNETQ